MSDERTEEYLEERAEEGAGTDGSGEGAEAGASGTRQPSEAAAPDAGGEGEEEKGQPKSYGTILEEEIFQGLHELERPAVGLGLSGLSAGLDIGFSVFLIATALTLLGGPADASMARLVAAALYPVGFIFVVVGRSELFTEHTTLAAFPVLGGQAPLRLLARLWIIVYAANLVGAAVFAGLAVLIGPRLGAVEPRVFGELAHHMTDHPAHVIVLSALLAGWMMGLLSWLVAAAQETISRIVLVWLITFGIGLAGLHHCIVGSVEVLAGVFSDPSLGMGDYGRFLLWSTLGNAAGGVFFVGLIKYSHAVKGPVIPSPRGRRRG